MVPGNLFPAASLAASVYLPWAVRRKFLVLKKSPGEVEKGAASGRKRVRKREKMGQKTEENVSESGRKWVGKR